MYRRLDDALVQGAGIRDDALADLIGYDADVARTAANDWKPVVLVRNRAPRPRGGVAMVEIEQWVAHVPVGPGSAPATTAAPEEPPAPSMLDGHPLQVLERTTACRRVEAPRHYPDNDLVALTRAAVWVDSVPAYGIRAVPLASEPVHSDSAGPATLVHADERMLDNGIVRVTIDQRERLILESTHDGRHIAGLVGLHDMVDQGDLYTPSIRGVASTPILTRARITKSGPLLGELTLEWRLDGIGGPGATKTRASEVTVRIIITADSPLVRLHVDGINRTRDHRLQLVVATDVRRPEVWADAALGSVRREPLVVPDEDRRMEAPPTTAPLHRFVSLFGRNQGATLFSDGLAEYESRSDGSILLTLVRAVGELSRNDLPERPGHAGWPVPTPRAQSIGAYSARCALLLHGPRGPIVVDEIERAADDALLPLEGRTLRSALDVPPPVHGVELVGTGLAFSALKESENGDWIVARCVNLLDDEIEGVWRFGTPVREARYARLDETPLEALDVSAEGIAFQAPPRAIVTVLVR
jgi:hypothetical protein